MKPLVVVASLLASTALAEVPTLAVSAGYGAQILSHRQWDLVDGDDHLSLLRVAGGTGFVLPFGLLDVELGFAHGAATSAAHVLTASRFTLTGLQLAGTFRLPVTSWFHPYAQLGGGVDWVTLNLGSGASSLGQTVATPSGTGLLGVQFAIRMGAKGDRRLPWLVFDLGGGAVLRPAARFDAMAPPAPEQGAVEPLARGTVNLGSMPLTAGTFRVLVGVRY